MSTQTPLEHTERSEEAEAWPLLSWTVSHIINREREGGDGGWEGERKKQKGREGEAFMLT